MKIKDFITGFTVSFVVAFIVNATVVYGWSYFNNHEASFNWPLSFAFGIILGVLCPFITRLTTRKNDTAVIDK